VKWTLIVTLLAVAVFANGTAAAQWKRPAPKIEGCATVKEIVTAEAFNRGHAYKDAHEFHGTDAMFLSRWVGMAFPGVSSVVVVSYSDGSAAVLSFVGAPECWRMQIMERRR